MGGSQQQLDAIIAETTVLILATPSPRLPFTPPEAVGSPERSVAHGDVSEFEAQQSAALVAAGLGSLDMIYLLVVMRSLLMVVTAVTSGNRWLITCQQQPRTIPGTSIRESRWKIENG